jgi:predicted nucleotidyltransferase
MSRSVTVTHETRNVNSKKLFSLIKETLSQVCDEYIIIRSSIVDHTYDYSQLATFADLFMEDLVDRKMISQYDVKCDDRNNDEHEVRHGNIHMEIKFRQMHCVNVTNIKFHFKIGR